MSANYVFVCALIFLLFYIFAVGKPIDVIKRQEPTEEEVDKLHKQYMDALNELFETHKLEYGAKESSELIMYWLVHLLGVLIIFYPFSVHAINFFFQCDFSSYSPWYFPKDL